MSDTVETVAQFLHAVDPNFTKQPKAPKEPKASAGDRTASTYDGGPALLGTLKRAAMAIPVDAGDDYHTWLEKIGMAIHAATDGSDEGRAIWNEWSAQSDKYDEDVIEHKWIGFSVDGGVTAGSLIDLANQHGFEHQEARGEAVAEEIAALTDDEIKRRKSELLKMIAAQQLLRSDADTALSLIKKATGNAKGALNDDLRRYGGMFEAKKAADAGYDQFPDVSDTNIPHPYSLPNVRTMIGRLSIDVKYDLWTQEARVNGKPLTDEFCKTFCHRCHQSKMFTSNQFITDGLLTFAYEHKVHPVLEYFKSLKWDGKSRLETWLIHYCGVKDTPGIRAISVLFFIAIVMRVRHPGCKWDYVLTFLGKEGKGKSQLFEVLAVKDDWLLENYSVDWDEKKEMEQTLGVLIAAYEEMVGHGAREHAVTKARISRRKAKSRLAYMRLAETMLRAFVLVASANDETPLTGRTGNRRFIPISIGQEIKLDEIRVDIDKLYAEAVIRQEAYFEKHGTAVLIPREHWAEFGLVQEERRQRLPLEEQIETVMSSFDKGGIVRASDLYSVLGVQQHSGNQGKEVAATMAALGWEKKKPRFRAGPKERPNQVACFVKGDYYEAWPIEVEPGLGGRPSLRYVTAGCLKEDETKERILWAEASELLGEDA